MLFYDLLYCQFKVTFFAMFSIWHFTLASIAESLNFFLTIGLVITSRKRFCSLHSSKILTDNMRHYLGWTALTKAGSKRLRFINFTHSFGCIILDIKLVNQQVLNFWETVVYCTEIGLFCTLFVSFPCRSEQVMDRYLERKCFLARTRMGSVTPTPRIVSSFSSPVSNFHRFPMLSFMLPLFHLDDIKHAWVRAVL